jgi:tetratricopeptide (TPR) repeat protein
LSVLLVTACGSEEDRLSEHLRRANEYFETERWNEARIEYWNALKLNPDDADAHFKMAEVLIRLREFRDARWEYQEAIRLAPDRQDWRMKLAEMLVLFNAPGDALEQIDAVLEQEPEQTDALSLRAVVLARKGELDEALVEIDHTLKLDPKHERALQLRSRLLESRGDTEGAESTLRRLVEAHPSVSNHVLFALFWGTRGESGKAASQYRAAVEAAQTPKERVEARQILAAYHLNKGDRKAAEQELLRAREEAPDDPSLALNLARLYAFEGQPDRAQAMLEARVQQQPDSAEPLLTLADFHRRAGDREKALETIERALVVEPSSEAARLQKAEYLVERLDEPALVENGRSLIDQVLSENPNSVAGLMTLAKSLLLEQKFQEAASKLQRVLDEQPSAQAHLLLGWSYAGMRQDELARSELLRAVQLDPQAFPARAELAALYLRIGERELALQEAHKALELRPDDPRVLLILAETQVRLDRKKDAVETLARVSLEGEPQASRYRLAMGQLYRRLEKFDAARSAFEKLLEEQPSDTTVTRELVALDLQSRDPERALKRANEAIARNPEAGALYALRGRLWLGFRKDSGVLAFPEEAERDFKAAIEKAPTQLEAYGGLGALYRQTGRLEEAIQTFEQAREKQPGDPAVRLVLATLYEGGGRTSEAIREYEEVVRLDPKQPIAKNNLAWLIAESASDDPDQLDRALEFAQDAREVLPDNANVADTLGWVMLKKDIPNAAIPLFREAIAASEPGDATRALVRVHLAQAYARSGNVARAIEELQSALAENDSFPGRESAQELLAELQSS